mmetsp:Transcript_5343/g.9268  ORF Transcript_5343/g.9268 Transcript_5343/m.9268 type:complete len:221 (+) Transcript_5343:1427-2089(+)
MCDCRFGSLCNSTLGCLCESCVALCCVMVDIAVKGRGSFLGQQMNARICKVSRSTRSGFFTVHHKGCNTFFHFVRFSITVSIAVAFVSVGVLLVCLSSLVLHDKYLFGIFGCQGCVDQVACVDIHFGNQGGDGAVSDIPGYMDTTHFAVEPIQSIHLFQLHGVHQRFAFLFIGKVFEVMNLGRGAVHHDPNIPNGAPIGPGRILDRFRHVVFRILASVLD